MAKLGDVKLRLDMGQFQATVAPMVDSAVRQAAKTASERARNRVLAEGLVNTGKLAGSMRYDSVPGNPLFPKYAVGSPLDYVKYPEFGTRAHGPVTAKALRFMPKGGRQFVFTTWVRGVRPYRFMRHTLSEVRASDFLE